MTTPAQAPALFTKNQFLKDECTHTEYYSQFITPDGIKLVEASPAFKKLKASGSTNLSDMPLAQWDCIGTAWDASNLLTTLGDHWSLGISVVINKIIAAHILGIK